MQTGKDRLHNLFCPFLHFPALNGRIGKTSRNIRRDFQVMMLITDSPESDLSISYKDVTINLISLLLNELFYDHMMRDRIRECFLPGCLQLIQIYHFCDSFGTGRIYRFYHDRKFQCSGKGFRF